MEKILFDTPMLYPNKIGKWSHLAASDIKTLHVFAEKIGLKRHYFQNKKKKNKRQPHYDLPEFMVDTAKKHGAIQITRKEIFLFIEAHY